MRWSLEDGAVDRVDATEVAAVSSRGRSFISSSLLPLIVGFLIVALLPLVVPSFVQSIVTKMMIYSIFGVSMNLLWGHAGIPTFGHATYFGIGAYATGILIIHGGISNFWVNLLLAAVISAVFAAILGVPAFRVYGVGAQDNPIYFLLVTIAFGELMSRGAIALRGMTGGSTGLAGIPLPKLGIPGLEITTRSYYYLVLAFVIVCLFLLYRVVSSHYGYALRGIHDNERRMQALGYNTWLYKYTSYIIAGLFGGVSGVLFAYFAGVVTPANLGMVQTDVVFLIVILGSTSIFLGPVLGSIVIVGIEYLASIYVPERWPLILAGIFVVAIMFIPQGLGVLVRDSWRRLTRGAA